MKNLRGEEAKRLFVQQNFISCSWHSVLPTKTKERCCCGNPLEQEVFLFNYINKNNPDNKGKFFAGTGCASRFQEFAHINLPPLFNPFEIENNGIGQQNNVPEQENENIFNVNPCRQQIIRLPVNIEFIRLTNLLFFIWFPRIEGFLYDTRNKFLRHPQYSLYDSEYKALFNAIKTTCEKNEVKKFSELLAKKSKTLEKQFRNFTFPIIQQYFENHFKENVL